MGALPRPDLPAGPVATLFARLHELHHRAGWPSLRVMARQIGCSHTTISAAFSRPVVPRWGLLELIVEELGGDRAEFHQVWLATGEPPSAGPGTPAPTSSTEPVARQLPANVSAFTGRTAATARLDELIDAGTGAVITGTAGVGKTALAVHWAHRIADRFPAGQLYVNLRGYDPACPVTASAALESLLRALGVAGSAIPPDQADRAALYRTTVAGKPVLMVLDNAKSVDQVRDLLPGGAPSFALVTSRNRMGGLVARHGAVRIDLDLLSVEESLALLRRLIGARVDSEPVDAARLVERCARLPLALRVAAELVNARPQWSLADQIREFDCEAGPLGALSTGDDEFTAVRTVLSWSCTHLTPLARRLFALLGVHPGRDIDRGIVAALGNVPLDTAGQALDELARGHLIQEQTRGQFGMHDLLHRYAIELAATLDAPERVVARDRLRAYLLESAAAASNRAFPRRSPLPSRVSFPDAEGAHRWLDRQWRNLVALAGDEPDRSAIEVSRALAVYLDERSRYDAAGALHERALAVARRREDRAGEGVALHHLGVIARNRGRYADALVKHSDALDAFRAAGDRRGEGQAMHGIGTVRWRRGDYAGAHDSLTAAVAIHRETGDGVDEGVALYGLGIASRRLGRYAEAEAHHRAAIALLRAAGDAAGEARALNNLGVVHLYLGRCAEAMAELEQALALHDESGSRLGQAVVHDNLGSVRRRMGDLDASLAEHRTALALYLDIGYRTGEADALRGIGATLTRLGRLDHAAQELCRAVDLGREIGEIEVTTGALLDLGDAQLAAGDVRAAVASIEDALALSEQAGDPYYTARALALSATLAAVEGDHTTARQRRRRAQDLFAAMGLPDGDVVSPGPRRTPHRVPGASRVARPRVPTPLGRRAS